MTKDKRKHELGRILVKVREFEKLLVTAQTECVNVMVNIISQRWLTKVFPDRTFDILLASKFRTKVGNYLIELEKIVNTLDAIESNGNPEIKRKRKSLVINVNNQLIPFAERLFERANLILYVHEKMIRFHKLSQEKEIAMEVDDDQEEGDFFGINNVPVDSSSDYSDDINTSDAEIQNDEMNNEYDKRQENENKSAKISQVNQNQNQNEMETETTEIDEDDEKEKEDTTKKYKLPEPRYKIDQLHDGAMITLPLTKRYISLDDITVQVKEDKTTLYVNLYNEYEIDFQIDSSMMDIYNIEYSIHGNMLKIHVPNKPRIKPIHKKSKAERYQKGFHPFFGHYEPNRYQQRFQPGYYPFQSMRAW
jgi:hypothetical protein